MTRLLPVVALAGAAFLTSPAAAQKSAPKGSVEILSQQISTSRSGASLRLELSNGQSVDVAIRGGQAYLNGKSVGDAPRGDELDNSFRTLLSDITESPANAMPGLLMRWSPAATGPGRTLDHALEDAVRGVATAPDANADAVSGAQGAVAPATPGAPGALNADGTPASDSVDRLNQRISELQSMVDNMNDDESSASAHIDGRRMYHRGPFQYLLGGIGHIFSILILFFILFAVAVGVIAFGGRKYIEGVAETARQMTMRSWLVGLAATFLVVPVFVLGILALAISIVGIPVLLAWVPLYPLAVIAALVLGFLAMAHAAGESLSEKRFYENDYFQRGNSYYFLLTGMGVLLAAFVAAGVVEMAGPWFGFIRGLLCFLGAVIMWVAFTVGFGAVLVSRGGKRPLGKMPIEEAFAEDLNV